MNIKDKIFDLIKDFSVSFYLAEFERVRKSKFSWNWSAFLFGPVWLAYRKMPGYCVVSVILLCLVVFGIYDPFILKIQCKNFLASPMLYVFFAVILIYMTMHGIFGNSLYFRWLRKKRHIRGSQPIAPIFASICLLFYVDAFGGALWLRHYRMTHNHCSGILTEINALLGGFASWIFVITVFSVLRGMYEAMASRKGKFVTFCRENAAKIIAIKPSIVRWFAPAIFFAFSAYHICCNYIGYFQIFLEKIS